MAKGITVTMDKPMANVTIEVTLRCTTEYWIRMHFGTWLIKMAAYVLGADEVKFDTEVPVSYPDEVTWAKSELRKTRKK